MTSLVGAALLLAVALTAGAPATAGGASCVVPGHLPSVEQARIDVSPDPSADPEIPGYAILMEFETQPEGDRGHAFFVRLSARGEEPLFRGERHAWAMVVELLDTGAFAIEYAYPDRTQPGHLWAYEPHERKVRRLETSPAAYRNPIYTVCDTVRAADLAPGIELTAATEGRVTVNGRLRRALSLQRGRCR
jgi:hypothetical protein